MTGCSIALVTDDEFNSYVQRSRVKHTVLSECNDLITGSYVIVDPSGRFFDNFSESMGISSRAPTPTSSMGTTVGMATLEADHERQLRPPEGRYLPFLHSR